MPLKTPCEPFDLLMLDPGVRALVAFLRSQGFETTDSGDGVTKFDDAEAAGEEPMDCALDYPNVFMRVGEGDNPVEEADHLLAVLRSVGADPRPGEVELSYDPVDGIALLMILDANDRWVRSFVAPSAYPDSPASVPPEPAPFCAPVEPDTEPS